MASFERRIVFRCDDGSVAREGIVGLIGGRHALHGAPIVMKDNNFAFGQHQQCSPDARSSATKGLTEKALFLAVANFHYRRRVAADLRQTVLKFMDIAGPSERRKTVASLTSKDPKAYFL